MSIYIYVYAMRNNYSYKEKSGQFEDFRVFGIGTSSAMLSMNLWMGKHPNPPQFAQIGT